MNKYPIVYAVKHNNMQIRLDSRSGGVFTAISDYVLNLDGVVYGCVLNEDFDAVHIRSQSKEERNKMRGSKYIQSDIQNCYLDVKKDLLNGKIVLFSGTSCQISAIKNYIVKDLLENLILVDIVCHGVPSSRVWHDFINWQEEKHKAICSCVDFRNKKDFGWNSHVESIWLKTNSGKIKQIDSEVYATLFYEHSILRNSCYQCPYKDIVHPGDITIADYWGIDKAAPGFDDNKGVSLVLINNMKGAGIFDLLTNIDYQKCELEKSMQPPLKAPFEKPKSREQFWEYYNSHSFNDTAFCYGNYSLKMRIRKELKYILLKLKRGR